MRLRTRLLRWRRRLRIARLEMLSRWVPRRTAWVRQAAGPEIGPADLVVACLVKDSEARVSAFLDYYLGLGARRIVLVDNGSSDGTIARASAFDERVTVLRCPLNYRTYQAPIKMWLARRFSGVGWCLVADIDEYLAYPHQPEIGLGTFLGYLNEHGYSGVVLQSVDLFSEKPASQWPESGEQLRAECVWYDHSAISHPKERRSFSMNRVSNPEIRPWSGGIRMVAFGLDRLLTKHVLIRPSQAVRLNGPHHSRGAAIADVSAALLHYPFDRGFRARADEAVRRGQYWQRSREFSAAREVLQAQGPLWTLKKRTASRLRTVDQLVQEGFLVVTEQYRDHVQRERRRQSG